MVWYFLPASLTPPGLALELKLVLTPTGRTIGVWYFESGVKLGVVRGALA